MAKSKGEKRREKLARRAARGKAPSARGTRAELVRRTLELQGTLLAQCYEAGVMPAPSGPPVRYRQPASELQAVREILRDMDRQAVLQLRGTLEQMMHDAERGELGSVRVERVA